jgi:uncharacterized protein YdhG (YjbR/CyaY superfamily)
MAKFETVDAYVASFPPDVRKALESVQAAIREVAPGTQERISYGIPTFTLGGRYIVYIAGWKEHISVYPVPAVDLALEKELARYKAGAGTLRFPLANPMPLDLIQRVVRVLLEHRVDAKV